MFVVPIRYHRDAGTSFLLFQNGTPAGLFARCGRASKAHWATSSLYRVHSCTELLEPSSSTRTKHSHRARRRAEQPAFGSECVEHLEALLKPFDRSRVQLTNSRIRTHRRPAVSMADAGQPCRARPNDQKSGLRLWSRPDPIRCDLRRRVGCGQLRRFAPPTKECSDGKRLT